MTSDANMQKSTPANFEVLNWIELTNGENTYFLLFATCIRQAHPWSSGKLFQPMLFIGIFPFVLLKFVFSFFLGSAR
jgi:hypothetical protein